MSKTWFLFILFSCTVVQAVSEPNNRTFFCNAAITMQDGNDPVFAFAKTELSRFLCATGQVGMAAPAAKADWTFRLCTDSTMKPYSFGFKHTMHQGRNVVTIRGYDVSCTLHGVYTLLEQVGYQFEITGPEPPRSIDLKNLMGKECTICPRVLKRGIRQHINFPMDISSYPLEEAKEYIRNLARLRFNYIIYHSYPGQWIAGVPPENKSVDTYAGQFFYGQRHDVPDHTLLKQKIRNKKVFCIPEIEDVYDNPPARGIRTAEWLRALMAESKRVGMTVEFSFEPRRTDANVAPTITQCNEILTTYPQIDVLEITTQETGRWGDNADPNKVRDLITRHFGLKGLEHEAVSKILVKNQPSLENFIGELGHNVTALKEVSKNGLRHRKTRLSMGVYCTIPSYLNAAVVLMRTSLPDDIEWAILPAHSNQRVYKYFAQIDIKQDEWKKLMVFNWFEFDCIMYLQQNSPGGIRRFIEDTLRRSGRTTIEGVCYNHWRTAENRTIARYAALTAIDGSLSEDEFYRRYAAHLGVGDIDSYISGMNAIEKADQMATEINPSPAFCFVGCWGTGLGIIGNFDINQFTSTRVQYETALHYLQLALEHTRDATGRTYLEFLCNRTQCSIYYFQGFEKAIELKAICGDSKPDQLSDEQRQKVAAVCDTSLVYLDKYMYLHGSLMPDRGSEGTLISFYYTPVAVVKRIRHEYGGIESEHILAAPSTADAPPLPPPEKEK